MIAYRNRAFRIPIMRHGIDQLRRLKKQKPMQHPMRNQNRLSIFGGQLNATGCSIGRRAGAQIVQAKNGAAACNQQVLLRAIRCIRCLCSPLVSSFLFG